MFRNTGIHPEIWITRKAILRWFWKRALLHGSWDEVTDTVVTWRSLKKYNNDLIYLERQMMIDDAVGIDTRAQKNKCDQITQRLATIRGAYEWDNR